MRPLLIGALDWASAQPNDPFALRLRADAEQLGLGELLHETPLAVDEALDGIRRMANVIREMKEFAGDSQTDIAELDINQAVCNVVEVSRRTWSETLDVELQLHPELPRVRCAAHPIKQAFLNVLTNAVEAVQGLGRRGTLTISSAPAAGGVELRFRDDGPGIPREHQPRIFEPFFTTTAIGQGMGQGLFVAYAIVVEQSGGRMHCESEPGAGALFQIWLPA